MSKKGDGIDERDNINTQSPPKQASQMENVQETSESTQNDNNDNNSIRSLHVDCDSYKIAQVIFNLLDNAMKFTFDGKVYVSTTITATDISGSSQSAVTNRDSTGNPKDIRQGKANHHHNLMVMMA
jgi:signal transduction histidine kinase